MTSSNVVPASLLIGKDPTAPLQMQQQQNGGGQVTSPAVAQPVAQAPQAVAAPVAQTPPPPQQNWKFKPQTPTDFSNGRASKRRNSEPGPGVLVQRSTYKNYVTHWKLETKKPAKSAAVVSTPPPAPPVVTGPPPAVQSLSKNPATTSPTLSPSTKPLTTSSNSSSSSTSSTGSGGSKMSVMNLLDE
eukprot:gene17927-21385_t